MKKKFDLFGLKAFDEKVDKEDAELTLKEQYYSQSVKHLKETRKSSKRFEIAFICMCVFLLAVFVCAIAFSAFAPNDVSANAQGEWYNYNLNISDVVLPFVYYGQSSTITGYFNGIYWNTFSIYPNQYIKDFYYEIYEPNSGDILGKGVFTMSNQNLTSAFNYGVNADFTRTTSSWQQISTYDYVLDGNTISYPICVVYDCEHIADTDGSSPLYFRFSTLGAVNLNNLKVRVILVDNYIQTSAFLQNGYPFLECAFSNDGAGQTFGVGTDTSYTTSAEPLYPIYNSYDTAFNVGNAQGFAQGYQDAKNEWYQKGIEEGSLNGYAEGKADGIAIGKGQGYEEGVQDANDYTFFSLVSSFFDAPVKVILGDYDADTGQRVGGLLNFDLLGVNISSFLLAIFTICVIIAVIKLVLR